MTHPIFQIIKRSYDLAQRNRRPLPEGSRGLEVRDYKEMVGGKWDEIGQLQIDFLKSRGMKPHHVLCDVGCGSFRAGRFFIQYLERGNYQGIDKQQELVDVGRREVITEAVWLDKCPQVVITDAFDFSALAKQADFAIANSLFTHLRANDIKLCLTNLKRQVRVGGRFYATFFESQLPMIAVFKSHSSRRFEYTRRQIVGFGHRCGWQANYLGDWGHPRKQMMIEFVNPA